MQRFDFLQDSKSGGADIFDLTVLLLAFSNLEII